MSGIQIPCRLTWPPLKANKVPNICASNESQRMTDVVAPQIPIPASRMCDHCGQAYRPRVYWSRFCRPGCKNAYHRSVTKAGRRMLVKAMAADMATRTLGQRVDGPDRAGAAPPPRATDRAGRTQAEHLDRFGLGPAPKSNLKGPGIIERR